MSLSKEQSERLEEALYSAHIACDLQGEIEERQGHTSEQTFKLLQALEHVSDMLASVLDPDTTTELRYRIIASFLSHRPVSEDETEYLDPLVGGMWVQSELGGVLVLLNAERVFARYRLRDGRLFRLRKKSADRSQKKAKAA